MSSPAVAKEIKTLPPPPFPQEKLEWCGRKFDIALPRIEFCGRVGKRKLETKRKNCKLVK